MSQPQIDVFTTSILSSGAVRGRHERVLRHLQSARLEFKTHDVASDEEAKRYWKRKNGGSTELPCVLVNGERVGSVEDLDEAVEFGELRQFLSLETPSPSAPPPAPLTDFSSLSLSPTELASLEASLADTYASTSLSTTSHSASPSRVPALPITRPLAQALNDELDGIVLNPAEEAEAEALAREWAAGGGTARLFSSIEGGEAALSAPLAEVGQLGEEERGELGGGAWEIEVQPSAGFDEGVAVPALRGKGSERKEVERLRSVLDADQGDTGEGSTTVPSFGLASVEEKVVTAIREGFI